MRSHLYGHMANFGCSEYWKQLADAISRSYVSVSRSTHAPVIFLTTHKSRILIHRTSSTARFPSEPPSFVCFSREFQSRCLSVASLATVRIKHGKLGKPGGSARRARFFQLPTNQPTLKRATPAAQCYKPSPSLVRRFVVVSSWTPTSHP